MIRVFSGIDSGLEQTPSTVPIRRGPSRVHSQAGAIPSCPGLQTSPVLGQIGRNWCNSVLAHYLIAEKYLGEHLVAYHEFGRPERRIRDERCR